MRAHIDDAFQAKFGTDRGRRHAMLARAGFGDNPGFAHAARQNDLAQHIVDLMRAGVIELVTLKIDLGAAQLFGHAGRKIEWAWAANVMRPKVIHLCPKAWVRLGLFIFRFEIKDQRHQGFRHEPPAKITKATLFVGAIHKAVEKIVGHRCLFHNLLYPCLRTSCAQTP